MLIIVSISMASHTQAEMVATLHTNCVVSRVFFTFFTYNVKE